MNRASGPGRPDAVELTRSWGTVVRSVLAVQQSLAARVEAVGISLPYVSVLMLLLEAEDNRLPMSRIARDLAMTSGGFTKLADRMARDGLIDRRGSSGDRRVVFAALTEQGRTTAERAQAEYVAFLEREVLSHMSSAEFRQLSHITATLRDAHVEQDADTGTFHLAPRGPDAPERRGGRSD